MLKRTISGAAFVAIVVGFFLLRQFVDYRLFLLLLYFFSATATFEVARALKPFAVKGMMTVSLIFAFVYAPSYALAYLTPHISGYVYCFAAILLGLAVITVLSLADKSCGLKKWGVSVVPMLYPALFMLTMFLMNDNTSFMKGFYSLLLLFVVSPFCDTAAYLVGMTYNKIKKGKAKKMCPVLSPKKTWAGAIGGLIGGAIGGLIIYFIFKPDINFFSPLLFFIVLGLVASAFTQAGDLFESFIKRRAGIKDMGKIMPGHGGIADRIDGMLFAGVLIWFVFLFV